MTDDTTAPRGKREPDEDAVAWAIEVTVRPNGAEPYDAIDDVYLSPAGAYSMSMNYTAGADPRVVPLFRRAPTQEEGSDDRDAEMFHRGWLAAKADPIQEEGNLGTYVIISRNEWERVTTEHAELTDEKARCPKCGHYWASHTVTTKGTMAPCPPPVTAAPTP